MRKIYVLWIIAIIITIASAYYQRLTGPTHPQQIEYSVNGKHFKQKLLRSCADNQKAEIIIKNKEFRAELFYKHFPIDESEKWIKNDFIQSPKGLVAVLPNQPAAGKLIYYLKIYQNNIPIFTNKEEPVIIRFKGAVPNWILIFHILAMFTGMMFANMSGLLAVFKMPQARNYMFITLILLTIGGMMFGPVVQKYAFGDLWTGIPFGWDLTDNKTLIAFVAWIIAAITNYKKNNFTWIVLASIITLIIFSIPHSLFGSTLDRETGKVMQGTLLLSLLIKKIVH